MGNLKSFFFFFQAEDGIRYLYVTGVQTCALPICDAGLEGARVLRRPRVIGQEGHGDAQVLQRRVVRGRGARLERGVELELADAVALGGRDDQLERLVELVDDVEDRRLDVVVRVAQEVA